MPAYEVAAGQDITVDWSNLLDPEGNPLRLGTDTVFRLAGDVLAGDADTVLASCTADGLGSYEPIAPLGAGGPPDDDPWSHRLEGSSLPDGTIGFMFFTYHRSGLPQFNAVFFVVATVTSSATVLEIPEEAWLE